MIELKGVGVDFGRASKPMWALRGVDLTIHDQEFVSVVGTSGCGKSTMLSVVGGLLPPSEGDAEIDGVRVTGPGLDRGMVFQNYGLFPWLTAQTNIEFALAQTGVGGKRQRADRAREMLSEVGLLDFADKHPSQLSGGMRQRVAIARVLAYRPSILLMDEPFGALDALTRRLMQELLVKIWESSKISVLFITHDIAEAVFLSDRVVVMSNRPGRVLTQIPVDLPRPRTEETVRSTEFVELEHEILGHIRGESIVSEHFAE